MADNRADTRVSMRTPLSRVKGLGAAHHGVEHWWLHRLTAVSNLPLVIGFVVVMALVAGQPHGEVVRVLSHPAAALVLALCVVSVATHMRLGMQIVIEDYVHDRGWRLVAVVANTFFTVAVAAACLFSILKIALGRVAV
jgi:succinate dehydrogenase / fumarate reductase membrane anchor subunit